MSWQDISTAPRDGTKILCYGPEGHEIMEWIEREDDCPDQPGNDAGWIGSFAWPGRSWGADGHTHEGQGQPYCWQPLIDPDIDWDAEPPKFNKSPTEP